MSKKRLFQTGGIILLLSLILGLAYLKQSKNKFATDKAVREFAVKEGKNISRIFMVDRAGKYADLKKQKDGSWMYNDTFEAWQSRVDFLIDETISKLAVKSNVPKQNLDNVLRRFTIAGVKVEIYSDKLPNGKLVYYVGGTTADLMGTYFLLEGDKMPYVVHIPGFNGYLNTRYTLDKDEWISRRAFASKKEEIEEVKISYPEAPKASFIIKQDGDQLNLEMEKGQPANVSLGAVKSYLNFFEALNFEGYVNNKSKGFIDSLKATKPIAVISVKSKNRNLDILSIYPKPSTDDASLVDREGNMLAHDADRFYAIHNKLDNRLLLIQDYNFGKVLVRYQDLLMRN